MLSKRILDMEKAGLGLERGEIRLSPHQLNWKRIFSDEANFIFDQLRDESLRLYHCGSTSVPGLQAKPILDIVGSVASIQSLDAISDQFLSMGYEIKGEYGISGRRYYVLSHPEKTKVYVHLHLFQHENPQVARHLLFRDLLRNSEQTRIHYEKEKLKLMSNGTLPQNYAEAKSDFIAAAVEKFEHLQKPKKVLAVLGAAPGHSKTHQFLVDTYGDHLMEVVDLGKASVSGFSYLENPDDAFVSIVEKAIAADLLVLATPVYWYTMSGPLKDFIDRFSNLMGGPLKHLGESLHGKKVQVVSTGYLSVAPLGFEVPFACTSFYFGMDYLGCLYKSTSS